MLSEIHKGIVHYYSSTIHAMLLYLINHIIFHRSWGYSANPLHRWVVLYMSCVSEFSWGLKWPEGGSSINVTPGEETDELPSLQSHRFTVESLRFFTLNSIYLHCRDRLLTLIEKHGLAPASSFICERHAEFLPSEVCCTRIAKAQPIFFLKQPDDFDYSSLPQKQTAHSQWNYSSHWDSLRAINLEFADFMASCIWKILS